jgi:hypothetical protein
MIASIADLVTFLKRFHHHWLDNASLDPALVPADLPDGLATIYRELGALVEIERNPSPFATQDALMPVSRLKRVNGMVEFAWENQGNWSARCPVGMADPPVYSNAADVWEREQRGFIVVCESLNHFLITLCLQEAVMGCCNLVALHTDLPPDRVLTVPLQPLWLDGYYVAGEADHQFFESPELDVLVMDWAGVWVGSPVSEVACLVKQGVKVQVIHHAEPGAAADGGA